MVHISASIMEDILEAGFLKLKEIRRLQIHTKERNNKIIGRCNWYMFCAPDIRGKEYKDSQEFFLYCHKRVQPKCPLKQMKPTKITGSSAKDFITKLHKPYKQGTLQSFESRDIIAAEEIQRTLTKAWERWQREGNSRARQFEQAIDSIPKPERIKKVVCLGLGRVLTPNFRLANQERNGDEPKRPRNIVMPRNIAQHIAAISIVKQLEKRTGHSVPLYTADPDYGAEHKKALETLPFGKFIVLNPSYGKHQQFTYIDDNTLVFDMAGPPECPTMRIIQEYARPVAIITMEIPRKGTFEDRLWFEVADEESGNEIQIPGCAQLPLPEGCFKFGGWCPRRVRDMIVYEYKQEDKFPAEKEEWARKWGACDLVDYDNRGPLDAQIGAYWHTDTRLGDRPISIVPRSIF
ncbi:hypothetical protein K445DRAFT_17097 [Daldinia sp. EC12]|nr:hypothetical protein K445DRAFT_17097 [Daldinia sp. EC12]